MSGRAMIVDGHLDLAMNALLYGRDLALELGALNAGEAHVTDDPCRGKATVTLGELGRAGVGLCFGTLIARASPSAAAAPAAGHPRRSLDFASPWHAEAAAMGQLAYYDRLERSGRARVIHTREDLREHVDAGADAPLGVVLLMEGTDAIVDAGDAELWYERGLRIAGLAHYGEARAGGGTGTTSGLTAFGRALLAEFERLGVVLDATHLSDESMAEALDTFGGRVIASHSNCRALADHQRQLSDGQARAIIARDGVIGAVLYAGMIDARWRYGDATQHVTIDRLCDHVDHVCQLAGDARHAGIGSDLDGGFGCEATPAGVRSVTDLRRIGEALSKRGYSDEDVERVYGGNWLRLLGEVLPA